MTGALLPTLLKVPPLPAAALVVAETEPHDWCEGELTPSKRHPVEDCFGTPTHRRVSKDRNLYLERTPTHRQISKDRLEMTPQAPRGLRTPSPFHTPVLSGTRPLNTPPPPQGPRLAQASIREDIDAALSQESMCFLSLTFHRVHSCPSDHCAYEAVLHHHVAALAFVLKHHPAAVDERCRGVRPLHLAIQSCNVKGDTGYRLAELLLEHRACPNPMKGDSVSVESPLHAAAQRGSMAAVELLLRYGADPSALDMAGRTPLMLVCMQAQMLCGCVQEGVVATLLRSGATPYCQDIAGRPPLRRVYQLRDRRLESVLLRGERHFTKTALHLSRGSLASAARRVDARGHLATAEGGGCGVLEILWLPGLLDFVLEFLVDAPDANQYSGDGQCDFGGWA